MLGSLVCANQARILEFPPSISVTRASEAEWMDVSLCGENLPADTRDRQSILLESGLGSGT